MSENVGSQLEDRLVESAELVTTRLEELEQLENAIVEQDSLSPESESFPSKVNDARLAFLRIESPAADRKSVV